MAFIVEEEGDATEAVEIEEEGKREMGRVKVCNWR